MSDQARENFDLLVNASLDGTLTDRQRNEFSSLLVSPEFLEAHSLQKEIDESVGRQCTAPDSAAFLHSAMNGRSRTDGSGRPPAAARYRLRAIAAGILLAILGAGAAWQFWPEEAILLPAPQTIEQMYADAVRAGFKQAMAYKEPKTFAIAAYSRLGKPVLPSEFPPGVENLGYGYCNCISPWTIFLMARIDDKPVMVFVDRADHDAGQKLSAGSGLQLASRRVEDMVLYEISPLDQPRLLNHFAVIPMPPDWIRRDQCEE